MSAVISGCGRYRYRLARNVQGTRGIVFGYFGVNPSTADAELDDQTILKWKGFTRRNNGHRFIVGNPFALRATDVRELARVADPIGAENYGHLLQIIAEADVLVPCWGNRSKVPSKLHPQFDEVTALIFKSGKPVKIFGLTKSGDPKHPLMLAYDTPLIDWERPLNAH